MQQEEWSWSGHWLPLHGAPGPAADHRAPYAWDYILPPTNGTTFFACYYLPLPYVPCLCSLGFQLWCLFVPLDHLHGESLYTHEAS